MDKIYVYDGMEVILTGRKANKKLRSGKMNEVVEIKQADAESASFKKWVRQSELFEILEDEF
jgi:hypothetical protein